MDIGELKLNIKTGNSKALDEAVRTKLLHKETFEEAWERIFAMKNTDADKEKLIRVMEEMKEGTINRHPDKANKKFSKTEAKELFEKIKERDQLAILEKMVEETPSNYHLITDKRLFKRMFDLLKHEEMIVFDVETTGTDVWEDYIVGHVLTATSKDLHFYIPTKHKTKYQQQLDHDYVTNGLREIYEDVSIKKVAHNAKYDIHMLLRENIRLKGFYWDTLEAMRLLNENEPSFALKRLVTKYLGIESLTYGDLFNNKGFDEVPLNQALAYAAKDGDVTYKLMLFQQEHLGKMPEVYKYYEEVEAPLASTIVDMESLGFNIDLDFAKEYGDELRENIEGYSIQLEEAFGDINLNSPIQLKEAIESYIGEEIADTNANNTLKPLSKEHEIIKVLLKYRDDVKMLSTYIDALPKLINEKTGKLHTRFNQNGAKTGRFSSGGGGTNLQNQPSEARSLFKADKGKIIIGGDFS